MNLFIIGNGFDIAHHLPTKYIDFKEYLTKKYPGSDEYYEIIPDAIMDNHGNIIYNNNDVAGYISRIIDNCSGGDWSDLEYYLGDAIFDSFIEDFDQIDTDTSDKELYNAVNHNEALASEIRNVFPIIKSLFCDWINERLSNIRYSRIKPSEKIAKVIVEGDLYLSFNYTMTLEELYHIPKVCHIHGKVGDSNENIFFGHGDEEGCKESLDTIGADFSFNELKSELRKNTQKALDNNIEFFNDLNDVETIHSFGFSFSDVDMIYVEEIARQAKGVIWYLNERDAKKTEYIKKLEILGFEVKSDSRW